MIRKKSKKTIWEDENDQKYLDNKTFDMPLYKDSLLVQNVHRQRKKKSTHLQEKMLAFTANTIEPFDDNILKQISLNHGKYIENKPWIDKYKPKTVVILFLK